jgi:hypothetical protein
LKAQYDEGIHGIVGDATQYQGSDAVYTLSEDTLAQCFCAEDNQGIQTNWWEVSSLNQNEIEDLKTQGWIYVSSGAAWGLKDEPYMAKNSEFSCGVGNGGGETSTDQDGVVLANAVSTTGGSVLGLAATGDNAKYVAFVSLGMAFVTGGLLLKKKNA